MIWWPGLRRDILLEGRAVRLLKSLRWIWLALLITEIFLLGAIRQATILTVCPSGCQFSGIQNAIEAAQEGDVIQIGAGTYQENIVVDKSITLSGTSPEEVLLRAAERDKPAVFIKSTQGVTLSGMSISGAKIDVQVENASANILNDEVVVGEIGIEVMSFGSAETLIQGNKIISHHRGLGIMLLGWSPCRIHNNLIQGLATGVLVGGMVICDIRDNWILKNWDGLLVGGTAQATIIGNQISNNYNDGLNLGEAATVQVSENSIRDNGSWGVSLRQRPCYETEEKFSGSIEGLNNEIVNNGRGDLCPPDYPWPEGFIGGG